MASVFSKIVSGELPAHRVWEDEHHLAFLDQRPVQPGHTLVIPKEEVAYLFDMTQDEYLALWQAVRTVEGKLRAGLGCERVIVGVVGWEVPHVHVHLVPTNDIGDFPWPGPQDVDENDMRELAAKISAID